MKKSILNIGKTLDKKEQKNINGGMLQVDTCRSPYLSMDGTCLPGYYLVGHCKCCKIQSL